MPTSASRWFLNQVSVRARKGILCSRRMSLIKGTVEEFCDFNPSTLKSPILLIVAPVARPLPFGMGAGTGGGNTVLSAGIGALHGRQFVASPVVG